MSSMTSCTKYGTGILCEDVDCMVTCCHGNRCMSVRAGDIVDYMQLEYIGSFSVTGEEDQNTRAQYVREKLEELRCLDQKSKPVLLVISLSGIKVCSNDGQSVYMAHSLKRVSYATCDPDHCQFSFLAREPKGSVNVQYCHVFITESPDEAEELNAILGNAFKMAYVNRKQSQPSFNELIEQQIEAQKQKFAQIREEEVKEFGHRLSQISTSKIDERREERRRRSSQNSMEEEVIPEKAERKPVACGRKVWAKQAAGNRTHRQPFIHRQSSDDVFSSPQITSLTSNMRTYGSPVMALKESIDNHFDTQDRERALKSQNNGVTHSQDREQSSKSPSNGVSNREQVATNNNGLVTSYSPLTVVKEPENYLYPEMSSSGDETIHENLSDVTDSKNMPRINIQDRPLPETPDDMEVNGHDDQRYQNDSPFRYDNGPGQYEQGAVAPQKYDSLHRLQQQQRAIQQEDQGQLKQASWYQPGIPREIALEILNKEEVGSFIVRDSTTHIGCYALSVRVPKFDNPSGIAHYLIVRTKKGVRLKGLDKEWSSLNSLVIHHSVMPEMLPCTLRLPRNSNNPSFHEKDTDHDEGDPEYHRLTDFNTLKLS